MNKKYILHGLLFILLLFPTTSVFGEPVILALGDSLTAGFGVPEKENYPSRLQVILKENGYDHKVVNGGVSGDTTAGGLRRLDWLMKHNPKIIILALGANDGLRGMPIDEMQSNLEKIIQQCQKSKVKILLAGMKMLPNYGMEYTEAFHQVYFHLSKKYNLPLIPFLLEGVAGKREYTREDGIHPLGTGYEIITKTVWKELLPLLAKETKSKS
jgi:acyl-CoA thioesterase-1